MLFFILNILLISDYLHIVFCDLSSIKPKMCLEKFMSPFGLVIVQPLQLFPSVIIIGVPVNTHFVLE